MATLEAPVKPQTRAHEGKFVNEPFTDFSREDIARKMRAAIEKVRGQLGREYELIIGGKRTKTADKIKSLNPAKPSQIVGIHQKAGAEHVEPAMQAALKAFETWSRTSMEERAGLLFRVARHHAAERKRRVLRLAGFQEVSKNWAEADADAFAEVHRFLRITTRDSHCVWRKPKPVQLPDRRHGGVTFRWAWAP